MSQLSRVAHHWNTVMVLMVVTEAMAVTHHPMVMVVGTVVLQDHYNLRLDDRQATDHHDCDHLVVIIVVAHDMTIDDQIDHPIIGKAVQGLA
jgi:hypothetical protein